MSLPVSYLSDSSAHCLAVVRKFMIERAAGLGDFLQVVTKLVIVLLSTCFQISQNFGRFQ